MMLTTLTIRKDGWSRSTILRARSASCTPPGRTSTNCFLLSATLFPKDRAMATMWIGYRRKEQTDSGEGEHNPAQQQGDANEGGKNLGSVYHLFPQGLFAEDRKHHRDEEGKQHQSFKMREDHF